MKYLLPLILCIILSSKGNNAFLLSSNDAILRSSHHLHPSTTPIIKPTQLHSTSEPLFPEHLNIIYDSKCSVCQWEVDHLKQRMRQLSTHNNTIGTNLIRFTDLEAKEGYDESNPANGGVTYTMGMTSFHAVKPDGTILHGVPVFVEAYNIVEQGWIWEATKWPVVGMLVSWGYDVFAKVRTLVTRGSSVEKLVEEHYARRNEALMMQNDDSGEDVVCEPCQKKIVNEGR